MGNEEVQPNLVTEQLRESVVTMRIARTLNTAKFEGIVIEQTIEERIQWKNLEERDRKRKNWETLFLADFKQSHDKILEELNLSIKKAYFVDYLDKDNRTDPHDESSVSVDIDQLDTL